MSAGFAVLEDRAVIEVGGDDARAFLQRLVTNDVETIPLGEARYAALLTPQGKIIADFFVIARAADTLLLDAPAGQAADLTKRLTLYRLRANITIADRSGELGVVVFEGEPPISLLLGYDDPRSPGLWRRGVASREALGGRDEGAGRQAYHRQRILAGVPEGGLDFAYGDTFPHDANLDHLAGVDFRKGCYVGQEVVSRVQHRGTARKRIVKATFTGDPPPAGTEIMAGDVGLGVTGSSDGHEGLAMVRLDRAAETDAPLQANGIALRLEPPAWA